MNSHWAALRIRAVDPRLIDAALVVSGLALTVLAVRTPWSPLPSPVIAGSGVVGSLAPVFRRDRPLAVAVLTAQTLALTGNPGPLLLGLFSAAVRLPRRRYPLLGLIGVSSFVAQGWIAEGTLKTNAISAGLLLTALVLAAGAYSVTRRQLLASLHERAHRAETEQVLREEQSRAGERTRIAREMHDVIAHKVSLISLHAGGLEVNPTAGPDRIEQGAALIRVTAQEALEELRAILGVLRAETGPRPVTGQAVPGQDGDLGEDSGAFADLGRLIESWNRAGVEVTLRDSTGPLPAVTARTVYRMVQEGLTNAHRHAPGADVTVTVTGAHGQATTVTVTNAPPRPTGASAPISPAGEGQAGSDLARETGSGLGLVGLAERLRLVGGTLRSGPDDVGGWRLEGRLPWPAGVHQRPADHSRGVPRDQGSAGRR